MSLHCRERKGSKGERATSGTKLTLQEIQSGAAGRLPELEGPPEQAAAQPEGALPEPSVHPDTPFADASVQVNKF